MPSLMIKMTHKLSLPLASLLVGVCLLLVSCEDRSNTLGVGMMPDYTQFKSFDTTFDHHLGRYEGQWEQCLRHAVQ